MTTQRSRDASERRRRLWESEVHVRVILVVMVLFVGVSMTFAALRIDSTSGGMK